MNAFDALGLPQRLTLTQEEIETAWRAAGKAHHPDAGGDEQKFSVIREAKATLASPASRLAHWLEIHGENPDPRGTIDAEIMDLFAPVGEVVQQADALARRRATATTALGQAMLEGETLRTRENVEAMITRIDAAISTQCVPFSQWESNESAPAVKEKSPPAAKEKSPPTAQAAALRNLRFLGKWKRALMAAYAGLA